MKFKYILLLFIQIIYVGAPNAADSPAKTGGTLGLSIKGGVITIAGSNSPLSPTDSIQAAAYIPSPVSPSIATQESLPSTSEQSSISTDLSSSTDSIPMTTDSSITIENQ